MAQLVTLGETMAAFAPDRMGPLRYVSNYGIRIAGAESNTAIGGVTPENIPEFRKAGCLGVGFASSLMPKDKATARDWDACAEYVHMLLTKAKGE